MFAFRSKILFAYSQSQELKKKLKRDFTIIEECIAGLSIDNAQKNNLKELDKLLGKAQKTLSTYAINIHDLEYQAKTMEINLHSYKKWLTRIPGQVDEKTREKLLPEPFRYLILASESGIVIPGLIFLL